MPAYHLGTLDGDLKFALKDNEGQGEKSNAQITTFLNPRSWKSAPLFAKKSISWDTWVFTFKLEHEDQLLGLPAGQHLLLRMFDPVTQKAIIRPYTPLPTSSKKGYMDILIKLYLDTGKRKGGKMSRALKTISIGHTVEFKGPIGRFEYLGRGSCSNNNIVHRFERFIMICAGSGITPIYQVLHAVLNDPSDQTICTLLNGNRTVDDILCQDDIDTFVKASNGRVSVVHALTQATEGWEGLRGRIDGDLVRRTCGWDERALALVCGPEGLMRTIDFALREQGWRDEQIVFF